MGVFFLKNLDAQTIFSGVVSDTANNPIPFANIIVKKNSKEVIFFYTTKADGKFDFTLSINSKTDAFVLQVLAGGFHSFEMALDQHYNLSKIKLRSKNELPEVIIKSTIPILNKNDTVTYDVKSFSNLGDKVIGDVIRKLPGVEIGPNGAITYKGKSITHFYIEGDDLLGGKYNIATNNIPSDAVEKVQVLENHQSIRTRTWFQGNC